MDELESLREEIYKLKHQLDHKRRVRYSDLLAENEKLKSKLKEQRKFQKELSLLLGTKNTKHSIIRGINEKLEVYEALQEAQIDYARGKCSKMLKIIQKQKNSK